jgi:hypothetical protein
MKARSAIRGTAPLILYLCTRWNWVVNSCSGCFNPGAHWAWGWVDFKDCLDVLEKWQLSYFSQQSNHSSSIKQNCYKFIQDLLSHFPSHCFHFGGFSKFLQLWHRCMRATCRVTMCCCQVYFSTQCTVLFLMSVYYVSMKRGDPCLTVPSVMTHFCYLTHKSHGPYDRCIRPILEGTTSKTENTCINIWPRQRIRASDHDGFDCHV